MWLHHEDLPLIATVDLEDRRQWPTQHAALLSFPRLKASRLPAPWFTSRSYKGPSSRT